MKKPKEYCFKYKFNLNISVTITAYSVEDAISILEGFVIEPHNFFLNYE